MTFSENPPPAPETLHFVAEIDGSLNDAFRLTQNDKDNWVFTEDPRVTSVGSHRYYKRDCRSTSVGDVMEEDGKFYVVAGVGFFELEHYELEVSPLTVEDFARELDDAKGLYDAD